MLRSAGPLASSLSSPSLSSPFFTVSSLSFSHDRSLSRSTFYPLRFFSPFLFVPFVFLFFFYFVLHKNSSLSRRMLARGRFFFTSKHNAVSSAVAALCANDMPNCNHAKIQAALHLAFNVNRNLILTLCLLRSSLRSCTNKILDQVTALHGPTLDPVYQQLHVKQKLLHWLTIQSRRFHSWIRLNFSIELAKTILSDENVRKEGNPIE